MQHDQLKQELTRIAPALRRFAYSLTGSAADADDLLQNTLERLLSKAIPDDVELAKWAFRICRNLWIDEYRARKVRQKNVYSLDDTEEPATDGEQVIHDQITLTQVDAAMNQLPDEQRTIMALVAVQGLSYKEVAETLGIPQGTVMSRLARARVALVKFLNPTADPASA
ncbi:RNA polymerase sigma factor [Cellvibrio sp. KY-GH-1]|uniref:RNA polymerase sigma factor n=1 Tax=Cellvibrio sp. KY-GH-1 TaxID=2303332 RepID=UPI0012456AF7|nr:RNA polymerase sigma factor [Cellvibrio sp. KY-GH-1]QEY17873.1 RNA polymerase sigma factor [Cellvibrio sp. KY-GH-1]